jgi:hypothetical protein
VTRTSGSAGSHDHWRLFAEFCRYEKAVGGPSAHLCMVHGMSRDLPVHEKVWRVGCYGAVYNTGGAMALWGNLSRDAVIAGGADVRAWIADHWDGIPFHRHRRAVRHQDKLLKYLRSYALASRDWPDRDWWHGDPTPANYEAAWRDVLGVYGVGRYIAIRMLELFSRFGAGTALHDIRARDANSPRRTLSLLWPQHTFVLAKDNSLTGAAASESIANTTLRRVREDHGVELNHYELQVMTCEYHQSIDRKRQFPGRSIDGEGKSLRGVEPYWGTEVTAPGWAVRPELFALESLGEVNGWLTRDELMAVAADYGYTWSDMLYDYKATTDLSAPVRRAA